MTELACLPIAIGHADEGVCLVVRMGPHRVMLDCGLSSLSPILAACGESPPVDVVLCTHAHADHAQGLLDLHRRFPQMPIYASDATAQLLPLNWLEEQENVPSFCQALPWRSPVEFADGLIAELFPSGHLPGAAACLLTYRTSERDYTLFYTGDFFLSNSRLVDGMPLEELRGLRPDVLVVEGSYGTARHPHRRQQENLLAEHISRAIADKRSVLFPLPTIGLGQELLMLLRSHHHFTGQDIDIWVDEAIATGCDAYLDLLPHLPSSVQNFARHQPLFWDERIRPRVRPLPLDAGLQSIALAGPKPCIVLTHYRSDLTRYIQRTTLPWLCLLPQQPGRPGAVEAMTQDTLETVKPLKHALKTRQLVTDTYLLGEHCDGAGTTQLIHNLRPQHVLFVHGAPNYLTDLASLEELQHRYQLHLPSAGVEVDLPIGETFVQPAPPEARYEGELAETDAGVTMLLPGAIAADSRWQRLADTGIVEAHWQGEELVIRGMSQRELLERGREPYFSPEVECCGNCVHNRGQRCWNQASSLYGFRITPDGYCPAFEPQSATASGDPRINPVDFPVELDDTDA